MLTDTEELEVAWRALAGQNRENGRVTVPLGSGSGRFRAGIAYPSGEETLIVGFNLEVMPRRADLPEASGFRVEVSSEAFDPAWSRWLCLTRQDGAGKDLFAQMAADVVSAVMAAGDRPDAALLAAMLSRVKAWQAFMRRPRSGLLTPEEEVGLFGELTVLKKLVDLSGAVQPVIDAWVGPARGLQDFQTETLGLEVKSTLSVSGFPARISSLEQLDPLAGKPVLLAAVRLGLDGNGLSLPDLVANVRALVAAHPRSTGALERLLMLSGYLNEAAGGYVRRFGCVEVRVFDVDETFPRLIRSEVRPEIRAATYDIDLDLVTTTPETLEGALVRFGGF